MANRYEDKVNSVTKALTILEELSRNPEGMGLIELSTRVGMNKTTVYRLLTSLMEKDFVEQDGMSGRYALGIKILGIASALYEKLDIRVLFRHYASELFQDFSGTIMVTREVSQEYLIVDQISAGAEAQAQWKTGSKAENSQVIPLIFLANAVPWQQGRNFFYEHSVRENAHLRQEMKQILLQGYAERDRDLGGIPAVAAPVFNFSKNIVYAVSIHGAVLEDKKIQAKWILKLLEMAKCLSGDLGYINYI